VQVGEQVIQLLLGYLLLKCWHFGTPEQDDVSYALVIRRHSVAHELLLEQPIEARPAQVALAIGEMTLRAPGVVNAATVRLLRSQPQFRVSFARLGIAAGQQRDANHSQNDGPNAPSADEEPQIPSVGDSMLPHWS